MSDDILDRAEALLDVRRYDAALDVVGTALTVEPESSRAHALACRAFIGLGRYESGVRAAQESVRLDPTWAYPYRMLAISLMHDGEANRGNFDGAVTVARDAVRLDPHNAFGYSILAEAMAKAGGVEDADAAIRHAITLSPTSAQVWVTASLVAIKARNWYAAEKAARRALALDPENSAATNNLGVALGRQGYWPLAAVAYVEAARTDPRDVTARNNVEAVGFRYLSSSVVPLLLLPLLVITPAFVATRLAIFGWLSSKPERLRPLALRLGLRVAGSKRRQRRFAKRSARVSTAMASLAGSTQWSALANRRRVSNGMVGFGGGVFIVIGLLFVAAAFSSPATGGGWTPALVGLAPIAIGALIFHRLWRRMRLA